MLSGACPDCGTEMASGLLCCPSCRRLVHSSELKELATQAERAAQAGDLTAELTAWRRALELLPPDSRQHEAILRKIDELGRKVDAPAPAPSRKGWAGGGLAVLGAGAFFLITKGKLLLTGLTKMSTLLSMLVSMGAYWAAWGWKFAVGLVISLYIHEMGHVAMLRRYGIRSSAPMFIPGLGAFVRMNQYPANAREDARVGLAGPMWGLGAALGAFLVFLATGWPAWAAIARVGAWINIFNLIPIWQLDGGRGFRSLSSGQRWICVAALAAAWYLSEEALLVLLLIGAVFRAFERTAPREGDSVGLFQYVFLVGALAALCRIRVPLP